MIKYAILILTVCSLVSCNKNNVPDTAAIEEGKKEILRIEKEFEKMVADSGISTAFIHFSAEDAVVNRAESLIKGKTSITEYYKRSNLKKISLTWTPDFVDISSSLDLAYTYGRYTFTITDSLGNKKNLNGIFHTVWKKQKDGSWKYVWD